MLDTLFHLVIALAAVIITGRLLGRVLSAVGQPPVIGEVVAGILLGPSLLGRVAPDAAAFILPASIASPLALIAQIGVIVYMFLVGLELDAGLVRGRVRTVAVTSLLGIALPFALGLLLAVPLHARLSPPGVPFTSFALFIGVAMSITAFPVLARILKDRGLSQTPLGVTALACAAADDVTAWCLLAFVVGVAQAEMGGAVIAGVLTLAYVGIVFGLVRPLVARLMAGGSDEAPSPGAIALTVAGLLLSAGITEAIGIHAIFGAFMFGAIIPHDRPLARMLTGRLHDSVTTLLLPAFFALTGMRTEIGLLSTPADWAMCGAIITVATAGKFGGALMAARMTGLNWRDAASLGVLMNTRGLMELVVLNIGLDLGVISPALFTMMVLMAIATTVATTPLLGWIEKVEGSSRKQKAV
jgi:Kef-type K+ transport system membrane component KefB